mgnify:CR=1 FL=1
MTLIELPRRRGAPRACVEPPPDLDRRIGRALDALGDLPDGLELPGLSALAGALIELADELAADPDLEDDDLGDEEDSR